MSRPAQRHKLSRTRDQRRALLKGMAESLIIHESILTTKPKARALRPYVEKLVTKARVDNQHARRLVRSRISTDDSLRKLFETIGPRFADRAGGYTRIEAAGWRRGDDAPMARISFVSTDTEESQSTVGVPATTDPVEPAVKPAPAKPAATKKSATKKAAPKPAAKSAAKKPKEALA
ncbi:MAG: 50S ribosomal protein L17 [Candidatus Saccharimonadales bacterium]